MAHTHCDSCCSHGNEHNHEHSHHHEHSHNHKHGHNHDHGHGENKALMIARIIISGILLAVSFFAEDIGLLHIVILVIAFLSAGYDIIWAVLSKLLHFRLRNIFDEEFLMLIAACGAFALGEYPEAVIIMLFYQIGELFQDHAVEKSRDEITKLMDIRPDFANLMKQDGTTERVDPDKVGIGDTILVKPGEKIPLDGIVLHGEAYLDTAALTGEAIPRFVHDGDSVQSGVINTNGLLEIKVTSVFAQSTASKILALIESDSGTAAKSEKFINKFAKIYTPIVVLLAVLLSVLPPVISGSFDFMPWIHRALMFLVISCPCALVISVPLAFFGGIGSLSSKGVLVKGSAILEEISKINAVAFDKTGTLTTGKLSVTEIIPANGFDENTLLSLSALAERNSTHPVAQAICKHCAQIPDGKTLEYTEIPGRGLCATVLFDDKEYKIMAGNSKLFVENKIDIPNITASSCTHISVNDIYAGCICVADTVKDEAKNAIATLKKYGFKTVILTGDSKVAAEYAADALGMEARYELLPEDKAEALRELMQDNITAFAGDGINDTPVLTLANVGFAMGGVGSDSAIEAADAVIMDDDPQKICTAVRSAKKTLKIAKENITFSLAVKVIIMILSAFGISNMYLAVFADVGVSVLAVCNSLRAMR